MGFAHQYAAAILERARVSMTPGGFTTNWSDSPRTGKYYPGVESFPLPDTDSASRASVLDGLCSTTVREQSFTLPLLGAMLQDSYGLVGRRLGIQANETVARLPRYTGAAWTRGTTSGGALYPVSIYWVAGPSGPLTPGVYYYANPRHAMQRLLAGDVHAEVRSALGGQATGTDQFLVLGIKYWQNAFKYTNFSFHVVSMDLGAVLQTWRIWAGAQGLRIEPTLWFDEDRLATLLGVPSEDEGIFAVVPLKWRDAPAPIAPAPIPTAPAKSATGPTAAATSSVHHQDSERSRRVIRFDTLQRMHSATVGRAAQRPAPGVLHSAATARPDGQTYALPDPLPLEMDVRRALRQRQSSFGRFDARRPVSAAQLATCLATTARTSLDSDANGPGEPSLARLFVFVNHVDGVEPGIYDYQPDRHTLRVVKPSPPGEFLQRTYLMANYNVEQAGVVVVPAFRVAAVLDAIGDRGYRLVNAETGAIAQTFYTVAAAMGLGAGVALALDSVAYQEELGLEGTDTLPMLIMMLGHDRPNPADFRFDIA